jgi:hypothetical protein
MSTAFLKVLRRSHTWHLTTYLRDRTPAHMTEHFIVHGRSNDGLGHACVGVITGSVVSICPISLLIPGASPK